MSTDPAALVAALWAQFRPLVEQRVRAIESAAEDGADLAAARRAAHNLAGSLGSYGHAEASAVAREIDEGLAHDEADPRWLREAAGRLRTAVDQIG